MASIVDELNKLYSGAADAVASDDDDLDAPQLAAEDAVDVAVDVSRSRLRTVAAETLEEDVRYRGRAVGRAQVFKDGEDVEEYRQMATLMGMYLYLLATHCLEDTVAASRLDASMGQISFEERDDYGSEESGDEAEVDSEAEDEEEDDEDQEVAEEGDMRMFEKSSATGKGSGKAAAIRQQFRQYEHLLAVRMKLQRVLQTCNLLPCTRDDWDGALVDSELQSLAKECREALLNLSIQLATLRFAIQASTDDAAVPAKKQKSTDNDEEIVSSDDEPGEEEAQSSSKFAKLEDIERHVEVTRQSAEAWEDATLLHWHEKTSARYGRTTGNNNVTGIVEQLKHVLSDKPRHVKRTQLKRSAVEDTSFSPHIFDDDDFYQALLRDVIASKAGSRDAAAGQRWLEVQRARAKAKRKVDTRASKGRRIRYDVHAKMVNFMTPLERCAMTAEAREDLYASVFGATKVVATKEVEETGGTELRIFG